MHRFAYRRVKLCCGAILKRNERVDETRTCIALKRVHRKSCSIGFSVLCICVCLCLDWPKEQTVEQNKIYRKKYEKRENIFCVCHNKERVQQPARERAFDDEWREKRKDISAWFVSNWILSGNNSSSSSRIKITKSEEKRIYIDAITKVKNTCLWFSNDESIALVTWKDKVLREEQQRVLKDSLKAVGNS